MKLEKEIYTDTQIAVLSGGCFWCTEAIFQRLKGVLSVEPGYAGGTVTHPTYEQVCSGRTGHAEAIKIIFDPRMVSYEKILDVFWHLHNPTTLNQQAYDIGPEYRSVIFYMDKMQKKIAEEVKKKLEEEKVYSEKIATEIVPFTNFFKAEVYHQNYFNKNMPLSDGYCQMIIDPKIKKLLTNYGKDVKEEYKK